MGCKGCGRSHICLINAPHEPKCSCDLGHQSTPMTIDGGGGQLCPFHLQAGRKPYEGSNMMLELGPVELSLMGGAGSFLVPNSQPTVGDGS